MRYLTQEDIDKGFDIVNQKWDRMVLESGESQTMFIAKNVDGMAISYLACWYDAINGARENGFQSADLPSGIQVNFKG